MKKIITFLLLLSSLCFGSEFKYYKQATIEQCSMTLNELSRYYKIISYQIVPSGVSSWIETYSMIIEVEERFDRTNK